MAPIGGFKRERDGTVNLLSVELIRSPDPSLA